MKAKLFSFAILALSLVLSAGNASAFGGRGCGYGGGGCGYGYGGYGGYAGYGMGSWGGYGYGGYGGYGGFGSGYYGPFGLNGTNVAATGQYVQTNVMQSGRRVVTPAASGDIQDFAQAGKEYFRSGNYQAAIGAFRNALIEKPDDGELLLWLAQSLFQTSQWTQAASATKLALIALPAENWGAVVQNYRQNYGNFQDYTDQLIKLEEAVKSPDKAPALLFLVGYHYGYLNYPKQAVRELGLAIKLQDRDPAFRRLYDQFAPKIGAPPIGPVGDVDTASTDSQPPVHQEPDAPVGHVTVSRLVTD